MNAPVQHSILVIEDDSVLNRLLLKTLVRSGFDMHGALTWAEARARIDEVAPDLVLLDMNLPDARDFTPLTEIAQTRPVIMLTAYGSINQAVEAMRLARWITSSSR
jgi:DNA-binding NtrC family response regulator